MIPISSVMSLSINDIAGEFYRLTRRLEWPGVRGDSVQYTITGLRKEGAWDLDMAIATPLGTVVSLDYEAKPHLITPNDESLWRWYIWHDLNVGLPADRFYQLEAYVRSSLHGNVVIRFHVRRLDKVRVDCTVSSLSDAQGKLLAKMLVAAIVAVTPKVNRLLLPP